VEKNKYTKKENHVGYAHFRYLPLLLLLIMQIIKKKLLFVKG